MALREVGEVIGADILDAATVNDPRRDHVLGDQLFEDGAGRGVDLVVVGRHVSTARISAQCRTVTAKADRERMAKRSRIMELVDIGRHHVDFGILCGRPQYCLQAAVAGFEALCPVF